MAVRLDLSGWEIQMSTEACNKVAPGIIEIHGGRQPVHRSSLHPKLTSQKTAWVGFVPNVILALF